MQSESNKIFVNISIFYVFIIFLTPEGKSSPDFEDPKIKLSGLFSFINLHNGIVNGLASQLPIKKRNGFLAYI